MLLHTYMRRIRWREGSSGKKGKGAQAPLLAVVPSLGPRAYTPKGEPIYIWKIMKVYWLVKTLSAIKFIIVTKS
jgi:hypothetical protein